jgi:dihydroxy-acid dehydratase
VGHITPEAYDGGVIAVVRNGDSISIDAKRREINLLIPETEIKKRLASWKRPRPKAQHGVLAKYARLVTSASEGAVTDKNF